MQTYVDEVCAEAHRRSSEIAETSALNTLYIGGGTPSVLPPFALGRIADACGSRSYDEWTVEVNPDDITSEYAAGLRVLGVNRVSMGVQSLDDGMLRWMNRRHDAVGARRAFRLLREAGFDNISVDVIFGVGGMGRDMLQATVMELLEWRPEHISAYQLSVEEGSALGCMAREGKYVELSDEECAAQYSFLCRAFAAAGYEHYEISNWALPGRRAIHNSAYWTRAPYVGLGPGAHSLRCRSAGAPASCPSSAEAVGGGHSATSIHAASPLRPSNAGRLSTDCDIRSWNSELLSGWTSSSEELTEEEIREERIMLGLRTSDGIPADLIAGQPAPVIAGQPGNLRIPEDSWFTADDIISSLI